MRRCNIPPSTCRHRYSSPCCKDCQEAYCENRCQNNPERCMCWADKPPRKKREHKVDSLRVAWYYTQGMNQEEIARRMGCHRHTVGTILHEMGVTRFGQA